MRSTSIFDFGDVPDHDSCCVSSELPGLTCTGSEHMACDLPLAMYDAPLCLSQEKNFVIRSVISHGSGASLWVSLEKSADMDVGQLPALLQPHALFFQQTVEQTNTLAQATNANADVMQADRVLGEGEGTHDDQTCFHNKVEEYENWAFSGGAVPATRAVDRTLGRTQLFFFLSTFNFHTCEQNTLSHCMYRRGHCVHTADCTDLGTRSRVAQVQVVPSHKNCHSISCSAPCLTTCTVHPAF